MKQKRIVRLLYLFFLLGLQSVFGQVNLKNSEQTQDIVLSNPNDTLRFQPFKKNVVASYYAHKLNGRRTANGSKFDNSLFTAAHRTLPFGTKVKVINPANGKSVVVTINDRGPFSKTKEIDITYAAFLEITTHKNLGLIKVNLEKADQ